MNSFAPGRLAERNLTQSGLNLAGAEGFEPPSSVLETDSLTVELTPLNRDQGSGIRYQSLYANPGIDN
jgi:hypothetical protein